MSSLKDKTTKYKNEIKTNFKTYNNNKKDTINTKKLNDFINISKTNKKNKFMYDSIKSLIELKQEENDENINPDEYISFIENQLNDDKTKKNIFDVFCDSKTQKISWNKFPLIAKELGNNELAENLMDILRQSKLDSKELNYEEFLNIINPLSEEEEENEEIEIKSNNNKNKKEEENNNYNNIDINIEEDNLKINDYMENFEDIPTYKQKKMIENKNKKFDEEISSSSKSINKISDDVIIEEQSEENKISNNEVDNDNEKVSKRYHRRYRSKKIPNNNINENNNNIENTNINHKSFNKYRKKHF